TFFRAFVSTLPRLKFGGPGETWSLRIGDEIRIALQEESTGFFRLIESSPPFELRPGPGDALDLARLPTRGSLNLVLKSAAGSERTQPLLRYERSVSKAWYERMRLRRIIACNGDRAELRDWGSSVPITCTTAL